MVHITFPEFDDFNIPRVLDSSIQDAGKWMSMVEYSYLVEMIEGRYDKRTLNIDNYLDAEFRNPTALFFTTNVDKTETGSGWKHLMVLEAKLNDDGIYIESLYRVGFITKDLPKGNELQSVKDNMMSYDSKYYYALKDAQYIKKGWLGYVANYNGLLERLDDWWITFGGGI